MLSLRQERSCEVRTFKDSRIPRLFVFRPWLANIGTVSWSNGYPVVSRLKVDLIKAAIGSMVVDGDIQAVIDM